MKRRNLFLAILIIALFPLFIVACGPSGDGPADETSGFSTTIWTNDNPARIKIAEYVQAQLRELNIDVSIEVMEWGAYLDGTAEGSHDMFILGWSTPTLDADYATYALFHSDNVGAPGNRSFFKNDQVDTLLDAGRQEADPDRRAEIYRELQEILVEEAPMAYLIHIEDLTGVANSVKNFFMTTARIFMLQDVFIEGEADGGDLIIATLSDAVALDPHGSNDVPSSNVAYNIYESLVYFDRNSDLQPLLATDWEAVDELTWEFKLREGVKFHDGSDLNAEVVKANFDRLLDPDIASPRLFLFSMIDAVNVIDDYTVQFVTTFPFAPLPAHLAHSGGAIISLEAIEQDYAGMEAGDEPGTFISQNPTGTGYFKFESWEPGNQIVLVRNEDYWGELAGLNSVTFKVVPEDLTRLSELETGFAHIADPIQPSDVNRVENMPNAFLFRQSATSLAYIGFNCEKAPFDDVRVRQAISMAISNEAIVDGIYEGTAIPAVGPIAPGVFGYDPSVSPIPYDLERAKKLLSEAGY